jgi:signal transduction histidine kinase/HPt (histidine-containing phosphotransfer) domain-containing protein/ActR/RegA family two-component response regulator
MELIEIAPLVRTIPQKADHLAELLEEHWTADESGNRQRSQTAELAVTVYMKEMPPFFRRIEENANRLFFESSEKLRELESLLALQQERLVRFELISVALVVLLAGLAGFAVTKRIQRINGDTELALIAAREAREEAVRASMAKSNFVSRMSHELRTPLNAIIGFAQLLESEPLPPSQKSYVSLINSSGNHLLELINAVLDHAKIEAGGLTLEKISFDFPATIESVRSIVLDKASSKGLEFKALVDQNIPRRVLGDPTRLRQVLINLLVNAVKFTEKGSVELHAAVDEGMLVFSIRDTGIGMTEEMLGRLFQPFSQADETITRKYGGTGLGLLISKELIEAMNGTIAVESTRGVGTCFWIRLPLEASLESNADETEKPDAATGDESIASLVNGRVLLVDDNRVNLLLGSAMLERISLAHDSANNGLQALERVAQDDYRLVLMDMEMPEMDGLAATREIRRREESSPVGKHLIIIAMTANAMMEDRQRCFDAGMDGYISKPISLLSLGNEIRRLFGDSQTKASASVRPEETKGRVVFDRDAVLDSLGDEALFLEVAAMFVAEAPENLEQIDVALQAGNWSDLARFAHTLKGLAGTFVAVSAEAEARQLEHAALAGDAALCASLVPVVRERIEALTHALKENLR